MLPPISSDKRWTRYATSRRMNRMDPSTPAGRTVAAAWSKSGTDRDGPTVPLTIGTAFLVPYEPTTHPHLWGWDDAGDVATDVFEIVTLAGTGGQTRYRLRSLGSIRPMNTELNRGWTAHEAPTGVSPEYQYHGDVLIPNLDTVQGMNFVRAIARLRSSAAPPPQPSPSNGGGGSGRDRL